MAHCRPCVSCFSRQVTARLGRPLLVCLLAVVASHARADEPPLPPLSVNARAVPDKARVGEPLVVEVTITHVKEQHYDLTPVPENESFDVSEVQRSRLDGQDSSTTVFKVPMAGFQLGKLKTPQLVFEVLTDKVKGSFTVPGVDVEVVSSLPPDAQQNGAGMRDVQPPVDVAVRTWRLLYALAVALVVGLLAFAFTKYLKRPKPTLAEAPKVIEPLEVRVRKALDTLRAEDLPGKGRVREFYFRLSMIVRGYLGERYGFDAMESTTPELIESLRRLHTPGLQMKELQAFANESDFVRYAKGSVDATTCKAALELGYAIVSSTSQTAAPAAAHADQLRVS